MGVGGGGGGGEGGGGGGGVAGLHGLQGEHDEHLISVLGVAGTEVSSSFLDSSKALIGDAIAATSKIRGSSNLIGIFKMG